VAAKKRSSRRPPKGWIDHCINAVKAAGKRGLRRAARDPGAICGAQWYHHMTPSQKRAAKRRFPN